MKSSVSLFPFPGFVEILEDNISPSHCEIEVERNARVIADAFAEDKLSYELAHCLALVGSGDCYGKCDRIIERLRAVDVAASVVAGKDAKKDEHVVLQAEHNAWRVFIEGGVTKIVTPFVLCWKVNAKKEPDRLTGVRCFGGVSGKALA